MAPRTPSPDLQKPLVIVLLFSFVFITVFAKKDKKAASKGTKNSNEAQNTTAHIKASADTNLSSLQQNGRQIIARLVDGFCGTNEVHLSQIPHGHVGPSSWSTVLNTIHAQALPVPSSGVESVQVQKCPHDWSHLPLITLLNLKPEPCFMISQATLMTLFALTNARQTYRHASAAGHRAAYSSYSGQWTISWPIGKPCMVRLAPCDSYSTARDFYPPSLPIRVDKCVEMMAGIVSYGASWKIAFPGRAKHEGPWLLQDRPRGFAAAHGARHLYDMEGGKVFDVDLLALVSTGIVHKNTLKLEIPSLDELDGNAILYVPKHEEQILTKALDCLPWSSISWSLHRGMRDILLAYGKSVMNDCRTQLAICVSATVISSRDILIEKGWAAELVDGPMASMAESAILSGGGNDGDVVRMVVAIVECLILSFDATHAARLNLDKTNFWTSQLDSNTSVSSTVFTSILDGSSMDMKVALIKYFVLEWSQELDYQLYQDLPVDILLA